ncbi:MAG: hypothetical protein WKG01_28740 [Kofleriaceae bacterium]
MRTEHGEDVKCGATSFVSSRPILNTDYVLVEVKSFPVIGLRAVTVRDVESPAAPTKGRRATPATADDEDDDKPLRMPMKTLDAAIGWMNKTPKARMKVKVAPRGASARNLAAFENRIGFRFGKAEHKFFATHGYLRTRGLTVFGFAKRAPDLDLPTQHAVLENYIAGTLRTARRPNVLTVANAQLLRTLVPLMTIGNPIPFGIAVLVSAKGKYYRVDVRDFGSDNELVPETATFESIILDQLAIIVEQA